jgi:hypothetical protein
MELTEELRFVDLIEPGRLTSIGADGRLATGSYKVAQQWSAALKRHPTKPDGIRRSVEESTTHARLQSDRGKTGHVISLANDSRQTGNN